MQASTGNFQAIEALLRETAKDELHQCTKLTRRAREMRLKKRSPSTPTFMDGNDEGAVDIEELKALGEHESGEKLKNMIVFAKNVRKNLGKSFIDMAQLKAAEKLKKTVFSDQSRNTKMLSTLVQPLIPNIAFVLLLSAWRGIGRGIFHQIRHWSDAIELAAKGDVPAAARMLAFVWAGHILLQMTEYIELTYSKNTESRLGQSVRNGVLESMVRQDYEYFDKNSAGILQERLGREEN